MSALPPIAQRTVSAVLGRWARDVPDKVAVRDQSSTLTYRQLLDRATSLATGLRGAVGGGGRVALMLDNHVDMACAFAAVGVGGLVEVPVNPNYRGDVLVHQLNDSQATAMIVESDYVDRIVAVAHRLEHLRLLIVRGASAPPAGEVETIAFHDLEPDGSELPAVEAHNPVAIMYTSGTTGVSKGVLVSQAHAYTYGAPAHLGGALHDDVEAVVLPLFHVGGQWAGLYNAWIAGATAYVAARFDGAGFWNEMSGQGCTYALLVGTMANFLMQQPARDDDPGNTFRQLFVAPVPAGIDGFAERFDVSIITGYGSTEAGTVLLAGEGAARPQACGVPASTVEVRLVDENDIDVPDGEVGELIVRPREPWITMLEYVGRHEATVETWRNLWYHTGDAMFRDEDGQYVFVDRLGDAIRRRGENIPSAAVEGTINDHPAVLECAVVGVPGEVEHEVLAIVVTQPGCSVDPEDLLVWAVERLPHFMVPRYFRLVDDLDRTPSGKVRKRPLREAGLTDDSWDRERAGISVTRRGVQRSGDGV